MAIVGLILVGVGIAMIAIGTLITVVDWKNASKSHPGTQSAALGLSDTLNAFQKLVVALAKHPIGIRLIVLGIVCVLVGGILGGIAGISS